MSSRVSAISTSRQACPRWVISMRPPYARSARPRARCARPSRGCGHCSSTLARVPRPAARHRRVRQRRAGRAAARSCRQERLGRARAPSPARNSGTRCASRLSDGTRDSKAERRTPASTQASAPRWRTASATAVIGVLAPEADHAPPAGVQHGAEQLEGQVVQLSGRAGEHHGAHPLALHRHPQLAEHPAERAGDEVLVQHAELAALPLLADVVQHRQHHLGDGGVDARRSAGSAGGRRARSLRRGLARRA